MKVKKWLILCLTIVLVICFGCSQEPFELFNQDMATPSIDEVAKDESGKAISLIDDLSVTSAANVIFNVSPTTPRVGDVVTVKVTHNYPWPYVDLTAKGPNTVSGSWGGVVKNSNNGTWTWTWRLAGLLAGAYRLHFTAEKGVKKLGYKDITVKPALANTGITFSPAVPRADQMVTVKVTDTSPWVYVDLVAQGPTTVKGAWGGAVANGNGTWTWTWTLSGLMPGYYTVKFTSDHGANLRKQASLNVAPPSTSRGIIVEPAAPRTHQKVVVKVTDSSPWAYVGLKAIGPRNANGKWGGVVKNNDNTWTWTWSLLVESEGQYTLQFSSDNGRNIRLTKGVRFAMGPLKVPFITQLEPKSNGDLSGRNNCGPASAAMCIQYFGKRPSGWIDDRYFVHRVRYIMTGVADSENNKWTTFPQIQKALDYFKLDYEYVDNWSEDDRLNIIKDRVNNKGFPVILNVYNQANLDPRQYDATPAWGTSHILVVTGFDGDNVFVNDPLSYYETQDKGPNYGKPGVYKLESILPVLGHALIVKPIVKDEDKFKIIPYPGLPLM